MVAACAVGRPLQSSGWIGQAGSALRLEEHVRRRRFRRWGCTAPRRSARATEGAGARLDAASGRRVAMRGLCGRLAGKAEAGVAGGGGRDRALASGCGRGCGCGCAHVRVRVRGYGDAAAAHAGAGRLGPTEAAGGQVPPAGAAPGGCGPRYPAAASGVRRPHGARVAVRAPGATGPGPSGWTPCAARPAATGGCVGGCWTATQAGRHAALLRCRRRGFRRRRRHQESHQWRRRASYRCRYHRRRHCRLASRAAALPALPQPGAAGRCGCRPRALRPRLWRAPAHAPSAAA